MESGGWSEWKVAGGVSGKWRVKRVESGGWSEWKVAGGASGKWREE